MTCHTPEDDFVRWDAESVMCIGQNHEGACSPKASLATPTKSIRIECWNVRTMFSVGKTAQIVAKAKKYRVNMEVDMDRSCVKNETRFVTKNCTKLGKRREEKERSSERNMEENSRKREKSNEVQNVDRGSKNSYRQKEIERHSKKPYTPSEVRN